ncbi:MAG: hypothetical protein JJV98_00390 [Desulfosarcina sp.]|nr:hypothetical protein [Desulfobacterales bacterium]
MPPRIGDPIIFPFRSAHISAKQVVSFSPCLDILRHGLDDDLVMLRKDDRFNMRKNLNRQAI